MHKAGHMREVFLQSLKMTSMKVIKPWGIKALIMLREKSITQNVSVQGHLCKKKKKKPMWAVGK